LPDHLLTILKLYIIIIYTGKMKPTGFEWDAGNNGKNAQKHRVSDRECEEVFFDVRFKVFYDKYHSLAETKYYGLGSTFAGRNIFVVFTVRDDKIRVISARPTNKKERREYEKEKNTEG